MISEVYFLYACNRIKIGWSRNHIQRALNEISPYCPAPLFFIGATPGDRALEAQLHARFAADRAHGEWFDLGPHLREFLCEDQARARMLMAAERHYLGWLEEELTTQRTRAP
ncbi:GIY-YIG nuclease family protein [Bradyrhizobium sp. 179]|nr:GIY-YIG nuclease family protein [Bradyrhizobium sp. 179]